MITMSDMKEAEKFCLKNIQRSCFTKEFKLLKRNKCVEKNSKLYQLTPVLRDDLICVGGRTGNTSDLQEETKRPIILDSKDYVVKLFIQHYHRKLNHSGVQLVLNELRQKYWILQARKAIKNAERQCAECCIRKASPRVPPMGQLPYFRISKPLT